jgi:hypothetical protein
LLTWVAIDRPRSVSDLGRETPRFALRTQDVSRRDDLLAAVDVVRGAGQGGVGHQVHGDGGDVPRPDDAPDRERGAELLASRVELVAEQRSRQRSVDEAGGDEVHPDRRELQGGVCDQRGERGADGPDERKTDAGRRWRPSGCP